MIKLETVNIILAVIIIIVLGMIIYKSSEAEQFSYDKGKCNAVTRKYCNMMKNGHHNVFGDPIALSEMMSACGADAYPKLKNCYPKWAKRLGGTQTANIDLILKQVDNPMY